MYNILKISVIFLCISASVLNAAEFTDEYVQIISKKLKSQNNVVTAENDVVLYSKNYYITAQKLIYDKNSSKLRLFDNVNISKNNETVLYSEYVLIDVDNELSVIEPFLLIESQKGIWLKSDKTSREKDLYTLKDTAVSSCDCVNPDWDIRFPEGDYNTAEKWINTYHPKFYVKDTPVFYLPYFGFSTDDTRRSGLLIPTIGISNNEGFIYFQPMYYAPKPDYDFEFVPMVRTKRGYGGDLTFRYADSAYSTLKLNGGFFKELESYQEDNLLANDKHLGWSLDYIRTRFLSNENSKDGLMVKLQHMNDVDYASLRYDADSFASVDRYLESRIKYFYDNYKFYGELDTHYYRDLQTNNNDSVLQVLPSVTLHKYLDKFIGEGFTYSYDVNLERKDRKTGIGANTTNILLPLGFGASFYNDYINIDFTEEFKYTHVNFTNNNLDYRDLGYAVNTHILDIYTDLIKKHDTFTHALKLNLLYKYENSFYKRGDIFNENNISELDEFSFIEPEKSIAFALSQTFYDGEDTKEILEHKLSQSFIYDAQKNSYEKRYLENEIALYFYTGNLKNKTRYDYLIEDVTRSSSSLNLSYDRYSFLVNHIFSKDTDTLDVSKTLNYKFGVDLFDNYRFSFAQEYDLEADLLKKSEYIFNIDKKCWGLNLKFVDSYIASNNLTDNITNQNIFYIELVLKNLFKVKQVFNFD